MKEHLIDLDSENFYSLAKSIETPFNLENILRADEKLLALWKRKPFYFDINRKGDVVVRYPKLNKNGG